VVLAPLTVRRTAEAFVLDEKLGAATGDIEIDWDIVEEYDAQGRTVVGENGLPVSRRLSLWERMLAKSQFLEYLASFRLGRQAQAATGTIYTLAGAYSAIRRSALEACRAYSNRTVSEDTDLTWELHRCGERIGFVPGARVFLEPCTRWDELYAQRVRWARGQLEVSALNNDLMDDRTTHATERGSLVKMLLLDHTLAFPRLLWAPLLLLFPLLGYPIALICLALLGMYVLYLGIEAINTFSVFAIAEEDTRHRIERSGWVLFALPLYRFAVYYFRFSGFLVALTEDQQWTVPGHMTRISERFEIARLRSVQLLGSAVRGSMFAWSWAFKVFLTAVVPLVVGAAIIAERVITVLRRES
jgi:cellulose synthase/poly-beta-1,6-N-acetylglucosamine synthase-like glycosyltransferase